MLFDMSEKLHASEQTFANLPDKEKEQVDMMTAKFNNKEKVTAMAN